MIKKAPDTSPARRDGGLHAVRVRAAHCILWLQFGGPVPLKPEKYRFKVSFDEAALLVEQADVRMAGLDVGKVVDKELDRERGARSPTIELDEPSSRRSRATRA